MKANFSAMPPELSTAIVLGLFFTLGFLGAGYSELLSCTLGVIGAVSGGLIAKWWQIEEIPPQDISQAPIALHKYAPTRKVTSSAKSLIKSAKRKLERRRGSTLADWLLRKTKFPRK